MEEKTNLKELLQGIVPDHLLDQVDTLTRQVIEDHFVAQEQRFNTEIQQARERNLCVISLKLQREKETFLKKKEKWLECSQG